MHHVYPDYFPGEFRDRAVLHVHQVSPDNFHGEFSDRAMRQVYSD